MAPPKWATPEQTTFLKAEDKKWDLIKAGQSTLKGFYARTTSAFLQQWPAEPSGIHLAEANGDINGAKVIAQQQVLEVRVTTYAVLAYPDVLPAAH